MKIQSQRTSHARFMVVAGLLLAVLTASGRFSTGDAGERPAPEFVKLRVTHRVHLEFQDTLTVAMNERRIIGDTEFSCEAIEFYPQFAISGQDSTRKIISLSDDPKNPAFKIRVYENETKTEDTWAFYGVQAPHYGRTSYLAFQVLSFEYRGEVLGGKDAEPATRDEGKAQ